MKQSTMRSFETRLSLEPSSDHFLHTCADLFAHVKHCLFADMAAGKKAGELKNGYLTRFKITARHFNAARVEIEGKIAAIKNARPALIADLKDKITSVQKKIKTLTKQKADPKIIHQKKRRLIRLEHKHHKLEKDHRNGIIRCCFGGKKLFHAQFNLEENNYSSHEEWRKEWKKARSGEIYFLGSKDETSGNQTCTATIQPDQTINLRIRLPDALNQDGKYLVLRGIIFKYGKEELFSALKNPNGQAITWRFVHDKKGWRVFASFDVEPAPCISLQNTGAIGLDINIDHLALVETDFFGNPISKKVIRYNLHGKSSDQAKAVIGDATALAVAYAESKLKPLVIEELDFQKKKSSLREHRASYARMLSSFAYQSIITHLQSRAAKKGILVHQVNPAYTSIIGRVKFAKRYGLSIHQAAALCIARRYLRCSEKAPSSLSEIPDGKDDHVALSLPARNRDRHVWALWKEISKKVKTALAAHFRTKETRSRPCQRQASAT